MSIKGVSKAEKKLLEEHMLKMRQHDLNADVGSHANRARSINVGTAFGGVTDLMMRKFDGTVVWAHMQPVEVVELIHQLSANIGCHVALKPREDFASWRAWKQPTPEERAHLNGHPPFACSAEESFHAGKRRRVANQTQPQLALNTRSESNEQTVATEKTVGRKRAKRAATPA